VITRPALRRPPALAHFNFRVYLLTQGTSVVGTWMQTLGQAWLVLQLSGDPFVLGLVVACQGIPVAVFGLFGGVVADRMDKRRLIVITQALMLLLALGLGVLTISGLVEIWHVVVFALAVGTVFAIDMPARQAFVSEMVGPSDVASAVALNSTVYSAGRLVGPAVAGVVIAATSAAFGSQVQGTGVAFLVNAASYGAVILGMLLMRASELIDVERAASARTVGAIARQIGEGLRFVKASPAMLATLLIPGAIAIVAVNFGVYVPVMAKEAGLDASGLGLMLAAPGLGALLSAMRIGFGGRAGPRLLVGGAALLGATEVVVGLVSLPGLVLVMLFLAGAGATAMRASTNTMLQLGTPSSLRGRVMSLFTIVFEGMSPAGGLLAGALAAAVGGRAALGIAGAIALALAGLAGFVLLGRRERAPAI